VEHLKKDGTTIFVKLAHYKTSYHNKEARLVTVTDVTQIKNQKIKSKKKSRIRNTFIGCKIYQ